MRILALCVIIVLACQIGCTANDNDDANTPQTELGFTDLEWTKHGRTFDEQRYSPLTAINKRNVHDLGLAWTYDTGQTRKHESTPIIQDGIAYFTSPWSNVHAVDAVTGQEKWRFDPRVDRSYGQLACCGVVNRGVALWENYIFVGALDGRLIKLDKSSGKVVWEKTTVDSSLPYTITGAPRVIDGKVIIGNGGAEYGVRGYVSAYNAHDGTELWRFWTVPGNPEEGFEHEELEWAAETWNGTWWELGGGGTVWDSMAYDEELGLLFVGTGNGTPWSRDARSPGGGDNLFLSSILALDIESGALVWHYQTTPADNWDYTATQHIVLADLVVDGQTRKVLMQAPKNGFFYVLDRRSGNIISAEKYVPVTWASHVDKVSGRPVEAGGADYRDEAKYIVPGPGGAHNWQPMAFHPEMGLMYIPASTAGMVYRTDLGFEHSARGWNTGTTLRFDDIKTFAQAPQREWYVIAWDPVRAKEVWRQDLPLQSSHGGLLSTAGGLVFQGNTSGEFRALDAASGSILWQIDTHVPLIAPPVTYEVAGTQYVMIVGGSTDQGPKLKGKASVGRVFTFALNRSEAIPQVPSSQRRQGPIPDQFGTKTQIDEGFGLYFRYCGVCHGAGAISPGDAIPDLRYASQLAFESWDAIVLAGAYETRGMPSFANIISKQQADAIRAYVTFRAQSR